MAARDVGGLNDLNRAFKPRLAEEVPHAIEERLLLVLDVGHREGLGELLDELALLPAEARRNHDPDEDVQVAPPAAAEPGHTLAPQAENGA
jgi:hypothetical protein